MYRQIHELVGRIKTNKPLIINITNLVTMDFVANGLLCLGASPIMTQAACELDELMQLASGVVINIGTLTDDFITLCEQACQAANRLGKPITLDPVGAGASHYRTQTCQRLLERYSIAIVRANASEIMALAGMNGQTKGVDTLMSTEHALACAQQLATTYQLVTVISGATDAVVDSTQAELFHRGSPLMPLVTGSGCLLSAVVSSFASQHNNYREAAAAAVVFYGVCGELAAQKAISPGAFKIHFLDALFALPVSHDYE